MPSQLVSVMLNELVPVVGFCVQPDLSVKFAQTAMI